MTNDERIKAFTMRLDGKTWEEIGDVLHYAPCTARADIVRCINAAPRKIRCCYPAIRRVIIDQYGSIRNFSAVCGFHSNTIRLVLSGRCRPSRRVADAILAATGLSYEEAFRREGE